MKAFQRQNISALAMAARRMNTFNYPHSFTGTNSTLTNIPQKDVYPNLPRDAKEGDLAQYAHQNVREFPDWYKPYGFNYMGDGWMIFLLCFMGALGYSYLNDIKEAKGRRTRKAYPMHREGLKKWSDLYRFKWARDRLQKEDPNWTKFLEHKPRAAAHH